MPAFSWASSVEAPRCGVATTFSSSKSGQSVHGSLAKTSRPAAAIRPSFSASYSAASSTMPPRAALTRTSVGLALASCSAPIRPTVSGVLGRCTRHEVGLGEQRVEVDHADAHLRGAAGLHVGVVGDDVHPERREPLGDEDADPAEADDADGLLVELDAGVPRPLPLAVACSAACAGRCGGRRPASAPTASSAAETMLDVGALTTITPAWVAAFTSTLSRPTPARATTLSLLGRGERLGVDLGGRADQDRVDVGDRGQQLGAVGAVAVPDLEVRAERLDGGGAELLGDEYDGLAHVSDDLCLQSDKRRGTSEPRSGRRRCAARALYPTGLAARRSCRCTSGWPSVVRRRTRLLRHAGRQPLRLRCRSPSTRHPTVRPGAGSAPATSTRAGVRRTAPGRRTRPAPTPGRDGEERRAGELEVLHQRVVWRHLRLHRDEVGVAGRARRRGRTARRRGRRARRCRRRSCSRGAASARRRCWSGCTTRDVRVDGITGPSRPGIVKSGSVNSSPPDSGAPAPLVRPMMSSCSRERLPVPGLDVHVDPPGHEVGAAGQPVALGSSPAPTQTCSSSVRGLLGLDVGGAVLEAEQVARRRLRGRGRSTSGRSRAATSAPRPCRSRSGPGCGSRARRPAGRRRRPGRRGRRRERAGSRLSPGKCGSVAQRRRAAGPRGRTGRGRRRRGTAPGPKPKVIVSPPAAGRSPRRCRRAAASAAPSVGPTSPAA